MLLYYYMLCCCVVMGWREEKGTGDTVTLSANEALEELEIGHRNRMTTNLTINNGILCILSTCSDVVDGILSLL